MKIIPWLVCFISSFFTIGETNTKSLAEGVDVPVKLRITGINTDTEGKQSQWIFDLNAEFSLRLMPDMPYDTFEEKLRRLVFSPYSPDRAMEISGPDEQVITRDNFNQYREYILGNPKDAGFLVTATHDGPFPLEIPE